MRFLLDAQLSRRLAQHLAEAGFAASHVYDHLSPTAPDLEIARLANMLGACVISKDADFAELARRGILEQAFVWVRIPNINTEILWQRMHRAWPAVVSAIEQHSRIVEIR